MQNLERSILAGELARAFAYAELHRNLLGRYLQGDLPAVPKIPPFDDEEAALDKLASFIGVLDVTELRAALCGVAVAFQHAASGSFRSRDECTARLDAAKARLKRARQWLHTLGESSTFEDLPAMRRPGGNTDRTAMRLPLENKIDTSFVARKHQQPENTNS